MESQEAVPLIPMRDVVVFPHTMMPFIIGRQSSIKAFEHALLKDKRVFLATQRDPEVEEPQPADVHATGCIDGVSHDLLRFVTALEIGVHRMKLAACRLHASFGVHGAGARDADDVRASVRK